MQCSLLSDAHEGGLHQPLFRYFQSMNHPNRTLVPPESLQEEISRVSGAKQSDRPSLLPLNGVIGLEGGPTAHRPRPEW